MAADLDKPSLNALHRCDACASRAYVHVIIDTDINEAGYQNTGELFFCAHHAREHMPIIRARCNIRHYLDETSRLAEHIQPPEATELNSIKK